MKQRNHHRPDASRRADLPEPSPPSRQQAGPPAAHGASVRLPSDPPRTWATRASSSSGVLAPTTTGFPATRSSATGGRSTSLPRGRSTLTTPRAPTWRPDIRSVRLTVPGICRLRPRLLGRVARPSTVFDDQDQAIRYQRRLAAPERPAAGTCRDHLLGPRPRSGTRTGLRGQAHPLVLQARRQLRPGRRQHRRRPAANCRHLLLRRCLGRVRLPLRAFKIW